VNSVYVPATEMPCKAPSPDAQLVDAAKAGSSAAFAELFQRYAKKIYWRTFLITRNHEDAEDALQDSFICAYAGLKDFQGKSQFYSWLVRIAINSSLMVLRRKRRRRETALEFPMDTGETGMVIEPDDERFNPELMHDENLCYRNFLRSMSRLSPKLKVVVESRLMDECSTSQAGEQLGLSEAAVKSRLRRARQLMKKATKTDRKGKQPWQMNTQLGPKELTWRPSSSEDFNTSCSFVS
jgi:RNA polymerase sigma factor (sigma-70 family)